MKLLILIAAIATIKAASVSNSCTVSEWGEWKGTAPYSDRSGKSFPSEAPINGGKAGREYMMQKKIETSEYRKKCRAEGTCPELMMRQGEGAIDCINGVIDGIGTNDVLCENVHQQSFMNFNDLLAPSGVEGNDCWGWTSAAGAEIAIMGTTAGTTFVDISDPANPVAVAYMDGEGSPSNWRDMKVVDDYVYVVSESSGHGIQAFDLNRLAGLTPGGNVNPDRTFGAVGNCHNIIANDATKKIYAVGCTAGTHCADAGGLYIVDVTDPTNPILPSTGVNCYDGDGYVHDAQCVVYNGPDTTHVGKDICFAYNENTFTIVDVEVSGDISMLSRTGYSGSSYTHQGWVTEDHTVVLLDDELDEQNGNGQLRTYIWDVTDLDNPVLMNTWMHGLTSIDHNQYIVGDLTYQADYETGLQILKIDQNNFQLERMGFFDVYPSRDSANFFGSWSVYPYFASGNIVISSIDYGMYVVRHDAFASPKDSKIERTRYRTIMNAGNGECPVLYQQE